MQMIFLAGYIAARSSSEKVTFSPNAEDAVRRRRRVFPVTRSQFTRADPPRNRVRFNDFHVPLN